MDEYYKEIYALMAKLWDLPELEKLGAQLLLELSMDDGSAVIYAAQKDQRTDLVVITPGAHVGGSQKLLLLALQDAVKRHALLKGEKA